MTSMYGIPTVQRLPVTHDLGTVSDIFNFQSTVSDNVSGCWYGRNTTSMRGISTVQRLLVTHEVNLGTVPDIFKFQSTASDNVLIAGTTEIRRLCTASPQYSVCLSHMIQVQSLTYLTFWVVPDNVFIADTAEIRRLCEASPQYSVC